MLTLREPHCPLPLDTPDNVLKTAASLAADPVPEPLWVAQTRAVAAVMGVIDQVDTLLPAAKLASSDPKFYALHEDGVAHFPLRSAADIAATIEFVQRHDGRGQAGYVSGASRTKIAARVLERADAIGVVLPNDTRHALEMQAGDGTCTLADLRDAIVKRAVLLGGDTGTKLRKQAAALTAVPDAAGLRAVAAELEAVDVDNGFTALYATSGLQPPAQQLFQRTPTAVKHAAAGRVTTRDGRQYVLSDLAAVSAQLYQDWLGADAAAELRDPVTGSIAAYKLASVVPQLSPESTEQLATALRLAGVSPLPD
jgi:hypothetical protein